MRTGKTHTHEHTPIITTTPSTSHTKVCRCPVPGLLYVVDSADRDRVAESREELNHVCQSPDMAGVPVVVVANKQDLPDSLTPEEVSKELSVQELSMSQQCQLLPVCAVTGEGLSDAMDCMVDMVRKWKKGKGKHAR